MSNDFQRPHDAALAVQFSLAALRRSLGAVGVFDGEAGDEVHGLLSLIEGATGRLADQTDPAFVSIRPQAGEPPRTRLGSFRRARTDPARRPRLVFSRGERTPSA